MWLVFVTDIMCGLIGQLWGIILPIMGLQNQSRKPYNKQLPLISNVQSLQKNLKPQPYCIDLTIIQSIQQGLGLRFSQKDLTLG